MIVPLIKGLALTIKRFLNPNTCVTMQYPDERPILAPRFRGLPELQIGKDGREKCVACGIVQGFVPLNASLSKGRRMKQTGDTQKFMSWMPSDVFFAGFVKRHAP